MTHIKGKYKIFLHLPFIRKVTYSYIFTITSIHYDMDCLLSCNNPKPSDIRQEKRLLDFTIFQTHLKYNI